MAQYALNVNIEDGKLSNALAGIKVIVPALPGESDTVYVKRAAEVLLNRAAKDGAKYIAKQALADADPGLTIS